MIYDSTELIYHPVFQTRVNYLQHQHSKTIQHTKYTLCYFFDLIQSGTPESVKTALINRKIGKKHPDYELNKKELPHIILGCGFSDNSNVDNTNISGYTNLVYLDFDKIENPDELKNQLIELDFIVGTWLSVGGTGVGAVAYVENINSYEAYSAVYQQISNTIFEKIGTKADTNCKNPNRKNALSYDPALLRNYNPTAYVFNAELIENNKPVTTNVDGVEIDNDFYNELKEEFNEKFGRMYQKQFVVNNDGQPMPFKKLTFNPEEHKLVNHIDNKIISQYKNNINGLAITDDSSYIASVELNFNSKFKIKQGNRKKIISGIVRNYYLFFKHRFTQQNTPNLIYTLISFLNEHYCYDNEGINKKPIDNKEDKGEYDRFINNVIGNIHIPCLKRRKSFYSVEHYKTYIKNGGEQKDYIGQLLIDIGLLNRKIRAEKFYNLYIKYESKAKSIFEVCKLIYINEDLKGRKKKSTNTDNKMSLVAIRKNVKLALELVGGRNDTTLFDLMDRSVLQSCITGAPSLINRSKTNTAQKVFTAINELLSTNQKITKELISKQSGLSVRTIKYHWKAHKSIIENHNSNFINSKN